MIKLRCLGSIDLLTTTQVPATRVIAQPKRFALLAYLTLATPRGFHRRDTLIALFWPEADDDHARSGLRIGLSFLRRELGDVIITRGDDVAVDRDHVYCDAIEFEAALNDGDLEKALSLYHGDLLPGLHVSMSPEFERWLDAERERLKRQACDAALKLSTNAESTRDSRAAGKWLRFALNLAPDDEMVVQRLITHLDRAGDRSGALRTYEAFAERMVAELDATPSSETRALVAGIRARSRSPVEPSTSPAPPAMVSAPADALTVRWPNRRDAAMLTAGLFALVGISSAAGFLWRQPQRDSARPRIAIVALENQTGRRDLDYVGGAVADQIAHAIGERGLGDLVTLSALPPEKAGTATSPNQANNVAKATGARVVVTGAYTIEGDSLLLRVEIADANKQRLLAVIGPISTAVAKPSNGIVAVSSQALSSVARVVEPRLSRYMEQKGWSRPTPNEVYRASSEGFELFLGAKSTADYEKAIQRFAYAYSVDSTEINALFEMAIIEQSLEQWRRAESVISRANASRERMSVLETDFLDLLQARNAGNHRKAYEIARDAVERLPGVVWEFTAGYHALSAGRPRVAAALMSGLNPDDGFFKGVPAYRGVMAEAHHVLGEHIRELQLARLQREKQPELLSTALYEARALAALGRVDELRKLIVESEALPPQSGLIPALPPLRGLSPGFIMIEAGLELRAHGHLAESREILGHAVDWYRTRLNSEPDSQLLEEGLAEALYAANRWEDAGRVFTRLAGRDPSNVDYRGYLGLIALHQSRGSVATASTEWLANVHDAYLFGRTSLWRARLAAQLGDLNGALSLLHRSLDEGQPFGISIHRDPDLEPLRDLSSFAELTKPKQ